MLSHLKRLLRNRAWTTRDGCNTIILDRGVVRFDYPKSWSAEPQGRSVALLDSAAPEANRLEVSYIRVPGVDFSKLPVTELVDGVTSQPREHATCGPLREEIRRGIEMCWREVTFTPAEPWRGEETVCFRVCVARHRSVHCLITYEFRRDDAERCDAAWDTVLDTLALD